MAVVVIRCSGPTSPPSPPSDHFSGKTHVPGKLASFVSNMGKFSSFFGDASRGPNEIHQMLQGSKGVRLRFNSFLKSDGGCEIEPLHQYDETMERLLAHQGKEQFRSTAMAFLITNSLMMATPFEALADLCETDNSPFNMNMPVLLFVALVGAFVGGLLARQRRGELQRVNEQLRQINAALRRQAKIESYAPTLSYAPVGSRISEIEVIVDPQKQELISRLKTGKNFLRNQDPEKAFVEFKAALELAQNLKDPVEEKKAARGLGASLQRQGKYREAIRYHSMVLSISEREGEDSGNTEAYGAIADCYTELGELERAGKFYDNYIARLESD
ncbi:TPR_12 domain-containing protein [Cephalotus follicularis]|uniref:TPR_12 domain-containing protein n=1 Tax=Cephalotus follicularis TaxID=3775 RepID=A0A1Q3B0D0_CEPFO|nr:TPR_12 domain-containing protein [Cephalotus follicularis]